MRKTPVIRISVSIAPFRAPGPAVNRGGHNFIITDGAVLEAVYRRAALSTARAVTRAVSTLVRDDDL